MTILNPNDPGNQLIINPMTGQTPNPNEGKNESRSALVDPTSVTRPTIRIEDKDSALGYRIINIEDFHPEYMTQLSDVFCAGQKPIDLSSKPVANPTESDEIEGIEEESEEADDSECIEEETDFDSMSKSELLAYAEENGISVDKKIRADDIRKIIRASV